MSKASAEKLAAAGFKYIGRSYKEMNCQDFVEKCLQGAGISVDLKGSNAWYRKIRAEGWTGTPEECKARFGSVPKGAFLFILAHDGGEVKRGYHDGLGNAKHIGITTGQGEGAIHSSESRGGVFESAFRGKTIRGGGWNCVGLWSRLSYGEKIDSLLDGGDQQDDKGGETVETAVVWSANGGNVKLRAGKSPGSSSYRLYDEVPVGTSVEVLEHGDKWCKVSSGRRKGWYMMTEFLKFDGATVEPGEDPEAPAAADGPEMPAADPETVEVTLTLTKREAELLLKIADNLSWKLTQITGGLG